MDRYAHIIRHILSTPWAIRPEMAAIIQDIIAMRRAGVRLSAEEIQARIGAAETAPRQTSQEPAVAVIPIVGVIAHRMELLSQISSEGQSPETISRQFKRAMADPAVTAIVLDIDSPGGTVFGLAELGDEIRAARGKKKVVAIANGIAASAAYWLGSQAEEFVVTPSGQVGSIGVLSMHEDWSQWLEKEGIKVSLIHFGKYKVEGNPYEPLNEEARDAIQADVDAYGAMFHKAVARGRGVSVEVVRREFGQGRMVMAAEAVRRGMVDAIETFDSVLARLTNPRRAGATRTATATSSGLLTAEDVRELADPAAVEQTTSSIEGLEPGEAVTTASWPDDGGGATAASEEPVPAVDDRDYIQARVRLARRKGAEHGVAV